WGIVSCFLQVAAVLCGLPFGAIGVAISYGICTYILFVPAIVYAGQPLHIGIRELIPAIGPPLIGALLAEAVGFTLQIYYLSDLPSFQRMTALVVVCVVVYMLVTIGMFRMTKPIKVAKRLLSDFLPSKLSRVFGLSAAH
ncbi:MAG TPA: hypothetical protein DDY39_07480, partial [Nitrospira sp.]|nr:hypothetical protein [Nitrospira sp.]